MRRLLAIAVACSLASGASAAFAEEATLTLNGYNPGKVQLPNTANVGGPGGASASASSAATFSTFVDPATGETTGQPLTLTFTGVVIPQGTNVNIKSKNGGLNLAGAGDPPAHAGYDVKVPYTVSATAFANFVPGPPIASAAAQAFASVGASAADIASGDLVLTVTPNVAKPYPGNYSDMLTVSIVAGS